MFSHGYRTQQIDKDWNCNFNEFLNVFVRNTFQAHLQPEGKADSLIENYIVSY